MSRISKTRTLAVLTIFLPALGLAQPATAFSGFTLTNACSPLESEPQRFARHRDGSLTYRITGNYKTQYPDDFSQFLVRDALGLWEDYINSGYQWKDDIEARFSYHRQDPGGQQVYELKTVLHHEIGHAMGMQHSDACHYNISPATMMPYASNHRVAPGGAAVVQPTIGPELMNEAWTASSPGAKYNGPIDGYNRVPGLDDWEWINYAYPFQSISFDEILAGVPVITIDSTNAGATGGQTSFQPGDLPPIVMGDPDQGAYIDAVNVWVGGDNPLMNRSEVWSIENYTGFDITHVRLFVNRASTLRAIDDFAPAEFRQLLASRTSSPEEIRLQWSASFQDPWPDGAVGDFSLDLDVHDWLVTNAMMWFNSNYAWPIPIVDVLPVGPWGLTTPDRPEPGSGPPYKAPSGSPSEPTPVPTDIELVYQPRESTQGPRGLRLVMPPVEGAVIERLELVPVSWPDAELLTLDGPRRRSERLERRFETGTGEVIDLLPSGTAGVAPEAIGMQPDAGLAPASRPEDPPLSAVFSIALGDDVTYAVRVTAATPEVRATMVSLPEMNRYQGTRAARCAAGGDAASCCPPGVDVVNASGTLDGSKTRCSIGTGGPDVVTVPAGEPQVVATGDGGDRVYGGAPDSLISLGRGDDELTLAADAPARVVGGEGADDVEGSDGPDRIEGGPGSDWIRAENGDDLVDAGEGDDVVEAGGGDDEIYPGSGSDRVDAGPGDDRVVFTDPCELDAAKELEGGAGNDTLVLPVSAAEARDRGLVHSGFERVVEDVRGGFGRFADCEG